MTEDKLPSATVRNSWNETTTWERLQRLNKDKFREKAGLDWILFPSRCWGTFFGPPLANYLTVSGGELNQVSTFLRPQNEAYHTLSAFLCPHLKAL